MGLFGFCSFLPEYTLWGAKLSGKSIQKNLPRDAAPAVAWCMLCADARLLTQDPCGRVNLKARFIASFITCTILWPRQLRIVPGLGWTRGLAVPLTVQGGSMVGALLNSPVL